MTASENFVSRWARLKHEADSTTKTETDVAFDLESLPSIEMITADTCIGSFLRNGIPAELTRAALRQAWTMDPAIRDFIGIAENQWDFNDPGTIPGFGALEAVDLPALLERALGNRDRSAELFQEMPAHPEQAPATVSEHDPVGPDESTPQMPDILPVAHIDTCGSPDDSGREGLALACDGATEINRSPPKPRSHGGALPR